MASYRVRPSHDSPRDARQQAHDIATEILTPTYANVLRGASGKLPGQATHCSFLVPAHLLLLACAGGMALYFSIGIDKSQVLEWLAWARAHRSEGRVLFILVYAASLILMIPGSILALLAGAQRCCLAYCHGKGLQMCHKVVCMQAMSSRRRCSRGQ